jgi:hypothetical protein
MENKYEQLKSDVYDEIDAIEQTLHDLSSLKTQIELRPVDNIQKAAIGTFLMNFYVGVENIIKRICKVYYQKIPMGSRWHKELLEISFNPPHGKLPIIDKNLAEKLNPYLGFRHVFVSGYGFKLKIELMNSLINNVDSLWEEIKKTIDRFWDSFENLSSMT